LLQLCSNTVATTTCLLVLGLLTLFLLFFFFLVVVGLSCVHKRFFWLFIEICCWFGLWFGVCLVVVVDGLSTSSCWMLLNGKIDSTSQALCV
jgi:hypothetical protein